MKKGRENRPFFEGLLFAPCRTGRLHGNGRYCGMRDRSTGFCTVLPTVAAKKTAPFQGRGQFNREEVTANPIPRAGSTSSVWHKGVKIVCLRARGVGDGVPRCSARRT